MTLFSTDKPDRFCRVSKFWIDETSGIALALKTGVPSCQAEDEEGRIHFLLHLPIEEENVDRWCLWRPDQTAFDFSVRSHNTGDVSAICHVENPGGRFLPGKGKHTAILAIPSELEGLKPHELHRAVRVDTKSKTHRLVAKTKEPSQGK